MQILILTALAGIVGMGFGGLVSGIIGNIAPRVMCWLLSFAGGVMISVVTFKLVPEGIELAGYGVSIGGLLVGIVVVMILNHIVDKVTIKNSDDIEHHIKHAGHAHENLLINNPRLLRSGIIMLIAISLHNLPEGIAIGAAGTHDMDFGIMIAIVITLHCIPEGMAIASPLIGGGVSKVKAMIYTALSGVPMIIGGAIGMFVGGISDTALALALTAAGGAMLYVVFAEMMPQSLIIAKSRLTGLAGLVGILAGLGITAIH